MNRYLIILLLVLLVSCAPTHLIEPLKEGEKRAYLGIGGPMVTKSTSDESFPLPLFSLGVAKGLTDRMTYFNTFYLNTLQYGITMFDLGVLYSFLKYDNTKPYVPGLSTTLTLNTALDSQIGGFYLWPQVDFNFYWKPKMGRLKPYVGVENWFELAAPKIDNNPGYTDWLMNSHIGILLNTRAIEFNAEMKYISDFEPFSNSNIPIELRPLSNGKSLGFFIGLSKAF